MSLPVGKKTSAQPTTGTKTFSDHVIGVFGGATKKIKAGVFGTPLSQSTRDTFVYDNFDAADQVLNGRITPTGQTWVVTGPGANIAAIEKGALVSDTNFYAALDYGKAVPCVRGSFSLSATEDRSGSVVTIIASTDGGLDNMLHLIIGPDKWDLQIRVAGGSFDFLFQDMKHNLLVDGSAIYDISMEIDGDTVTVTPPNGIKVTTTDPDILLLAPRYGVWQIGPDIFNGKWHSVGMDAGKVSENAAPMAALDLFFGKGLTKRQRLDATLTGAAGWYRIATRDIFTSYGNVGNCKISAQGVTGSTYWDVDVTCIVGSAPLLAQQYAAKFGTSYITQIRASNNSTGDLSAVDVYKNSTDDVTLSVDFSGAFTPFLTPVIGATALPSASAALTIDFASYDDVEQKLTGAAGWYRIGTGGVYAGVGIAGLFSIRTVTEFTAQRWDFFVGAEATSFFHTPILTHVWGSASVAPNITQVRISTDVSGLLVALDVYKNTTDQVTLKYPTQAIFTPVTTPSIQPALPSQSVEATFYIGGRSAAAVANIATADATDLPTAITLANANKAKINSLLTELRTQGLLKT